VKGGAYKKRHFPSSSLVSLVAVVGFCLVGISLSATTPYVWVSTFTEGSSGQSSTQIPEDWSIKVWRGTPEIELITEHKGTVLKLRSHQSNVAMYKKMHVDLDQHPNLSWEWKVTELPLEGDARDGERDDQAAGIYVVFPKFPAFFNSRIIGYVWESDVPKGTMLKSRNDSRVHYIVVRSGKDEAGEWMQEMRNVKRDYEKIFKEKAPAVGGVSLMIDSDHTQSSSESFFGKIYFSPEKNGDVEVNDIPMTFHGGAP
jgi:hypothetical protein